MAAPAMPDAVLPTPTIVERPGVYDLTEVRYHADPVPSGSLSSSGARKLLPPSCPALFKYERDHPRPYKKVFDIGHAAHKEVLGVGPELVCVDRPRWDTNEVKAEIAAIRAAGGVPLKADEYAQVQGMAEAIRQHPVASALFNPAAGQAERSMFWRDDETGVNCRARLDWQPHARNGRLIVPDYKTCRSANPERLQRTVYEYGYFVQAFWYLDGVKALGLGHEPVFVFCAQEKEPPYLVTVFEVDAASLELGRRQSVEARRIYAECIATGVWPGYSSDVELISLPPWVERQMDEVA
jgi:hypothetical protein